MQSSVIGGAMLPHAPQFFTMPETEDRATVERVRIVAGEIGQRLKALKPDLWIIIANDHAEQLFHHVAPAFTVHVGGEATRTASHLSFEPCLFQDIRFHGEGPLRLSDYDGRSNRRLAEPGMAEAAGLTRSAYMVRAALGEQKRVVRGRSQSARAG